MRGPGQREGLCLVRTGRYIVAYVRRSATLTRVIHRVSVAAFVVSLALALPAAVGADPSSLRALATELRGGLDALQKAGTGPAASDERARAVATLVAALDGVTDDARAHPDEVPAGSEAVDIAKGIEQLCASGIVTVMPAAVRAAAWFGHPTAVAAFQTTGERLILAGNDVRAAYLGAAKDTPRLEARRAFVTVAEKVFAAGPSADDTLRVAFRAALDACAAACVPTVASRPPSIAGLVAAFDGALKTPDDGLFEDLALALARAPGEAPRAVLRRALKARKAAREATIVAVLRTLGETGDPDAVPVLLAYLPGTAAPVFEAAYFGLWVCKPAGLQPHAKAALGTLIPLLHEEGYAANAMSGAATPKAARTKERMAVVARLAAKMVPETKEGAGWWALLWKIVDAGGDAVSRSSGPPDRRGWTHVNGKVTPLGTDAWVAWWKLAK